MATMSNTANFLKTAGDLIKGDLADINSELKMGRERRQGTLWQVLTNLICYGATAVFADGYTKKAAKQFRADVMAETSLSEKQASKYTENISAALGVRGVRKGVRAIDGLDAAAKDGVKMVADFLKGAEIETFNQFMAAVRIDPTPVEKAAKVLHRLTVEQRTKAMARAVELDKDGDGDE
jgi:hypothetical protein